MTTVADLLLRQAANEHVALRSEDSSWTYAEYVAAAATRAAYLSEHLDPSGEPHVGVLFDNVPEFCFWLGGAALAGATVVGINPTRRGPDLARDIRHTDCQFVVTEAAHSPLLSGLDLRLDVVTVDDPSYDDLLEPYLGAQPRAAAEAREDRRYLLLFTSGTTAAPKAVICTQGRLAAIAEKMSAGFDLGEKDVCYCAMPLFHGNALMTSWSPALAGGATLALRRKFSASGFLADVRRYGVTYMNYVGRPLAYILATPERPDDAENTLRKVFGNEASEADMRAFEKRFGCWVQEGYGSSEGGIAINRTPDTPSAALGPAPENVVVLHPETGEECPPARFDGSGRLLNAGEAVGEIVGLRAAGNFEGYWKNEEATRARSREGAYWSGDHGYKDDAGFLYFAERADDWLRVDGENVAVAPIERILVRHPDIAGAAVYAVPDPQVGDLVMAAVELRAGRAFDPDAFRAFLTEQSDLGTKMTPKFIRIVPSIPVTATMKPIRRDLRREAWLCDDPVWWRPGKEPEFCSLTGDDKREIRAAFDRHGRAHAHP